MTNNNQEKNTATIPQVGNASADCLSDYTDQPSSVVTPQEKALLADPPVLVGEALLQLAAKHSTSDITQHTNNLAGKQVVSTAAIHARMANALLVRATQSGRSVSEVRGELTDIRKNNGVLGKKRTALEQKTTNSVKYAGQEAAKQTLTWSSMI